MKYFSMFSGIGGFELGINDRGTCIGFSEIDKYAIQIYKSHFPNHKEYGNARDIIPERIDDFDVLVGGFPCQAFSIAGKRGGFEDTRGTLFFEIARILSIKRPSLLLLENVKGLLSHDNGKTFGTILSTLSELGYVLEWQVLNSKNFGVPQNRERVFIVGHLGRGSGRTVFPVGETHQDNVERRSEIPADFRYDEGIRPRYDGIAPCLCSSVSEEQATFLLGKGRIRRLTPTECERLQGFPDGWTEKGLIVYGTPKDDEYNAWHSRLQEETEISDTQRYKCLGNAVTVNVIEAIFKILTLV